MAPGMSRTCDYVTLHDKMDFADVIKFGVFWDGELFCVIHVDKYNHKTSS